HGARRFQDDAVGGLRACRLCADAGSRTQILHLDGRALSSGIRSAHGAGGDRSGACALSGIGSGKDRGRSCRRHLLSRMTSIANAHARAGRAHRPAPVLVFAFLTLLLIAVAVGSMTIGAAGIPLSRLLAAFGLGTGDAATIARDEVVLWSIRFPRIALAGIVGALLAAGGATMQGLFRNPLADPALVGVSSGAALAAAITI